MRTANMAAVMALALSATDTGFIPPAGSPTPIGGLRPNGGKYGPFTIGARERSRLAWRQRVDAAARAWLQARAHVWSLVYAPSWRKAWNGGDEAQRFSDAVFARDAAWDVKVAALAAPRPWRSPRKPDPRRRYSRSYRRAHWKCWFV